MNQWSYITFAPNIKTSKNVFNGLCQWPVIEFCFRRSPALSVSFLSLAKKDHPLSYLQRTTPCIRSLRHSTTHIVRDNLKSCVLVGRLQERRVSARRATAAIQFTWCLVPGQDGVKLEDPVRVGTVEQLAQLLHVDGLKSGFFPAYFVHYGTIQ